MTEEPIIHKLAGLFEDIVGVKGFGPSMEMEEVPEWDSLKHIELLAAIENAFGIEVQFEDAIQMISGEAIIAKVKQYLSQR